MDKSDVLVNVSSVSKKFCRDLKRSLWYGVQDVAADALGRSMDEPLRSKEFWALEDVSFQIERGECLGLIGRNGAGKTTLLKILNGLIKPDSGRVEINGRVGALIALGAGFNPILTGRENIYVNGSILGLKKKTIDAKFDEIAEFSEIENFLDSPVQSYSSGMQVRLGFAIAAVLIKPDILLLDEVLAVGDAGFHTKCINALRGMQASGVSIILVSHNMHDILRYCDTGIYLSAGRVVSRGEINEVRNLYLRDQEINHGSGIEPDGSGDVPTGSGVCLDAIYITNEQGEPLKEVDPFAKICIHVPFSLSKKLEPLMVRLELAVNDSNGLFFQGLSPPILFPGGGVGATGEFLGKIDGLRTNSGTLEVGIALWQGDRRGKMLGWTRNNRIVVKNDEAQAGRAVAVCHWSTAQAH